MYHGGPLWTNISEVATGDTTPNLGVAPHARSLAQLYLGANLSGGCRPFLTQPLLGLIAIIANERPSVHSRDHGIELGRHFGAACISDYTEYRWLAADAWDCWMLSCERNKRRKMDSKITSAGTAYIAFSSVGR